MLNAWKGILWIAGNERNFIIELMGLLLNMLLIFTVGLSAADAAIILFACIVVLTLEMVNTCIEKVCDIIQPRYDERIKIIKDLAAAAVLVAAVGSVAIALLIYPKYIFMGQ